MCNEGELLEKFNIQLAPGADDLNWSQTVKKAIADKHRGRSLRRLHAGIKMDVRRHRRRALQRRRDESRDASRLAAKYGCSRRRHPVLERPPGRTGHHALLPPTPCSPTKGIPVVCETDIHGAITSLLVQAAAMDDDSPQLLCRLDRPPSRPMTNARAAAALRPLAAVGWRRLPSPADLPPGL